MTVQPIRVFGDPILRTPADPVVTFDKELRRLVKDLTETMRDEEGAGLAAPQIGIGLRVFTFEVEDVLGHVVNPVLDFPDDEDPSVVYLENDTAMQEVTKAAEVQAYKETFARIRDAALAPAATRTHLDKLSETLE